MKSAPTGAGLNDRKDGMLSRSRPLPPDLARRAHQLHLGAVFVYFCVVDAVRAG